MKKHLLALLLVFCCSLNAWTQTISDDKVLEFAQKEQKKGTSQSQIVNKLLQRGATVEQLRRIRKKVESQQKQLGAVSSAVTSESQDDGRMRRRQQSGLQIAEREELLTRQQQREAMESELAALMPDTLEVVDEGKQVFGRNIFNNELLTFEPSQNMATPQNYVLGPGDKVIIDIWGASQETFEGVVSPDGQVVVPGVGPIQLGGLSVQKATQRVRQQVGRFYQDCQIALSLGENRSIQVQVMGEVKTPGTYTLSSLSSTFNALYSAGGINDIGTLRNIKVYRQGRQVAVLDVYDYLLNGNARGDIRLQDNDVIVVGPYEALVEVRGRVKRPMFYEMRQSETVKQLLSNAGGFAGDAFTESVRLTRKKGAMYSMHTVDEFHQGSFTLMDGDSIFVDSVVARFRNMVEIRGAVMHPGQYELGGSIQSVRQLIEAAQGLREDAFRTRGVMQREKDDLTNQMMSVDLDALLKGEAADVPLRNGDILFIPSVVDMQGERTMTIGGEVVYPGTYTYAENTHVEDLILMAGGLTDAASTVRVDVYRRLLSQNQLEKSEVLSQSYTISLADGLRATDSSLVLMPYDRVFVRRSPLNIKQKLVRIEGCVNFEGEYAMQSTHYRLSDLVQAAGGLSKDAYTRGGRLMRRMTADERLQRENALRAAQMQMYEEAMQNDKDYNAERADSLMQLKLDMGDTYPVAVDLDKALAEIGGEHDILLREGDVLVVPQFSNTVKVNGEVIYPNSINYVKGKPLSYYIERAGGYANRARKRGTYAIYMNGAVKKLGRFSAKKIQPGCEIIVPTRSFKKGMSTGEIMAITSGTASLASVVVALMTILKK